MGSICHQKGLDTPHHQGKFNVTLQTLGIVRIRYYEIFEIDRRSSLQNVQNCKGQENMWVIYQRKKSCFSTSSQPGI